MSAPAAAFAAAAEGLVGTPFRLHGRNPHTGLDCVGLVGAALTASGRRVRYPFGYRLRNATIHRWLGFAKANGLLPTEGPLLPGDVMLTQPGPAQYHLIVAIAGDRVVHAHAGLNRVVVEPRHPETGPIAHWRLAARSENLWQH